MSNVVFITGSSTGFGRLSAFTQARQGDTVFATMRGVEGKNAEAAQALRDQAAAENLNIHVLELDVTDQASIDAAVQAAINQAGRIDVLVNNAGLGTFGITEAFSVEQTHHLFNVNVYGVLRVSQAVLPHMRAQGSGLIFNVSSGLGRMVIPFVGVYNATKWALEGLSESMRYELTALGIDVVVIEPGAFGTSFGGNMIPAAHPEIQEGYGVVAQVMGQFAAGFEEMLGNTPDPQLVPDAIAEIINLPREERPFRRLVGPDVQHLQTLNEMSESFQARMFDGMGLSALREVGSPEPHA